MSQAAFETPAEFRGRLLQKWGDISLKYLKGELSFPFKVKIKMPVVTEKTLLAHMPAYRPWRTAWSAWHAMGAEKEEFSKNFRTYKDVQFIRAVRFNDLQSVLEFYGPATSRPFKLLIERLTALGYKIPAEKLAIFSYRDTIQNLDARAFQGLICLLEWRRNTTNTETALRELQIPGLDTKWIERNQGLVLSLFFDHGLLASYAGSFEEQAGFRDDERQAVWFTSPSNSPFKVYPDIRTFSLQPSALPYRPEGIERVLMVENKTTFKSIQPSDGTLVLYAGGKAAISAVRSLKWLSELDQFIYWGDMDSSGYLILDRIRSIAKNVQSIFMGPADIQANMEMAVKDLGKESAKLHSLTPDEREARDFLFSKNLRIEQERLIGFQERLQSNGLAA